MTLDNLKTIALIGLVAFVVFRGCDEGDSPTPDGKPADVVAEEAGEAYLRLCADAYEASAADPAGDSNGHGERLLETTAAARVAALQPVADAAESILGGDKYTPDKAAAFDRAVAQGLRRAAQ